ncbi:hypothetical protein NLJ89_g9205 [Agrocybe chaxingu]|uniref:Uncharacterized protein n=1 Tax=Agrocybe chaxingu TaxID=84603 RepID=A0A9W8MRG1_9AGAR|nr:hypothetical protein NLJ89_g9205 [Agrocybe chaxingu]
MNDALVAFSDPSSDASGGNPADADASILFKFCRTSSQDDFFRLEVDDGVENDISWLAFDDFDFSTSFEGGNTETAELLDDIAIAKGDAGSALPVQTATAVTVLASEGNSEGTAPNARLPEATVKKTQPQEGLKPSYEPWSGFGVDDKTEVWAGFESRKNTDFWAGFEADDEVDAPEDFGVDDDAEPWEGFGVNDTISRHVEGAERGAKPWEGLDGGPSSGPLTRRTSFMLSSDNEGSFFPNVKLSNGSPLPPLPPPPLPPPRRLYQQAQPRQAGESGVPVSVMPLI